MLLQNVKQIAGIESTEFGQTAEGRQTNNRECSQANANRQRAYQQTAYKHPAGCRQTADSRQLEGK